MLLLLTAVLLQSTLPIGLLILAPRQSVSPPTCSPGIAMPARQVPRARQVIQRRPNVISPAQLRESQGNLNPHEEPLTRILSTSFPFTSLPCSPGVYSLINRQTGSVYIGESADILQRLHSHRSMLERKEHFCRSLQADFNFYGIQSFDVSILVQGPEYREKAMRREREKYYINELPSEKRYNTVDRCGDRNSFAGKSHSLAFRERLSAERKGIPNTTLGRPISIPPFRTRKGNEHEGGIFASVAEASRVTGMARRDIRRRINDPLFPNWKEVDGHRESP
jgi:predicted GIY-YIG superfamily endonuclease